MGEAPDIDWDNLGFDVQPAEKMYVAETKQGEAWQKGELRPYGAIPMDPAAGVLNYGQGIFEGMKAHRTAKGRIVVFRPHENAGRFASGAERLGMPPVPEEIFMDAIDQVVGANHGWVPPVGKGALYIRPVLWGSGPVLGVKPAPSYTFLIYVTPVGPYFKGGMTPIDLLISDEYHRAAPGGSGAIKAIGNYAPGMIPSKLAKGQGFAEVIYLDAEENKYIEEVGAANFFCVKDKVIYTPELTGTILPGITRKSVISLAESAGYAVKVQKVGYDLAMSADEAFCTGTAAVISPIGSIAFGSEKKVFGGGAVGAVSSQLYETLTAIHQERTDDPDGWLHAVEPRQQVEIAN